MTIAWNNKSIEGVNTEGNKIQYDFKSIGQSTDVEERFRHSLSGSMAKPIGIVTPIRLGYGGGIMESVGQGTFFAMGLGIEGVDDINAQARAFGSNRSSVRGSLFAMHTDLGRQIADNFRNMIATNHGERMGLHDFGGNLLELAFELTTESADVAAVRRIKATTEKYMPFIQLETFEPFREEPLPQYLAKSGVRIIYSVPSLNLTKQAIEVVIYAGA